MEQNVIHPKLERLYGLIAENDPDFPNRLSDFIDANPLIDLNDHSPANEMLMKVMIQTVVDLAMASLNQTIAGKEINSTERLDAMKALLGLHQGVKQHSGIEFVALIGFSIGFYFGALDAPFPERKPEPAPEPTPKEE